MKQTTTIQERLWDLRMEKGLKLEELAAATGISKSALGSYEKDEIKEINHGSLVALAKFYGVSTDYLLCLTENKNHPNTELTELHLSDAMVDLLKSGRINNRLLCEIATHKDFAALMTDTEIYVDGIATMRFQDLNNILEVVRSEILSKYQPVEEDTPLKALQASQIQEEDYFCHATHRTWDAILHDIRKAHEGDTDSAPGDATSLKLMKDIQKKALVYPGTFLDVYCVVFCMFLHIRYEKLTEQERKILKNIMKKSPTYRDSPLSKQKR